MISLNGAHCITLKINLKLTDMVHGSGAKFGEKYFDPEKLEVLNDEGPEVEDVVAGKVVPLLDDQRTPAQQLTLDGGPKTAWPAAHNASLFKAKSRV
jgi:hypothetical protein